MLSQQHKPGFGALAIVLAAGVLLASCQDLGHKEINRDTILALATACEAYTGALRVVTPLRREGKLTADQVAAVDRTIIATNVTCSDEPPVDAGSALLRVTQAINTLLLMQPTEGT